MCILLNPKLWSFIWKKLRVVGANLTGPFSLFGDILTYRRLVNTGGDDQFPIRIRNLFPCFADKLASAGDIDPHYFLQDIYMARKVIEHAPAIHYDIGSRINGFIANLLAAGSIGKLVMIDIRPFPVPIEGLDFLQGDATNLDSIEDGSLTSLSSLHAFEHFGLGRYGDPIDPMGWRKALKAAQVKLAPGAFFYFSVPVGKEQKVCFNAHRIFDPRTIVRELDALEMLSFAIVHDYKVREYSPAQFDEACSQLGDYDCGMFVFRKR